jgi:hypothetical protein
MEEYGGNTQIPNTNTNTPRNATHPMSTHIHTTPVNASRGSSPQSSPVQCREFRAVWLLLMLFLCLLLVVCMVLQFPTDDILYTPDDTEGASWSLDDEDACKWRGERRKGREGNEGMERGPQNTEHRTQNTSCVLFVYFTLYDIILDDCSLHFTPLHLTWLVLTWMCCACVCVAALLERFTALLSSSHESVQLASCKAIGALLRCSDVSHTTQAHANKHTLKHSPHNEMMMKMPCAWCPPCRMAPTIV